MQTITTIGFDIAKSVFQVHELMPVVRWWSASRIEDALGGILRGRLVYRLPNYRPCGKGLIKCLNSSRKGCLNGKVRLCRCPWWELCALHLCVFKSLK